MLFSMLSLTEAGLTFPERSIPALQWILWQHEQRLETELQSLAHIHPSHLTKKCKLASVLQKKLHFWSKLNNLGKKTEFKKTLVVHFCCCYTSTENLFQAQSFCYYKLKCFFNFQCCAIWAAETRSALSAVTECSSIENNEKLKPKHSSPVDMQHTDVEWKKTTLRIHRRFELLHPDEFHLVVVLTAVNQKMGP